MVLVAQALLQQDAANLKIFQSLFVKVRTINIHLKFIVYSSVYPRIFRDKSVQVRNSDIYLKGSR